MPHPQVPSARVFVEGICLSRRAEHMTETHTQSEEGGRQALYRQNQPSAEQPALTRRIIADRA